MNSPSGRPNRRTPIVVTIVSLAIVIAAVIIVVAVRRHREQRATKAQSGGMANMPGMAMPGMAGAPQSPSAGEAAGSVTLSAAQERQLGVTFGSVEMRSLVADTRAVGVVTVDESRLAQVAPKFSGFVERLYVNETGQSVARGQPILDIYSPDVLAAEQELLELPAWSPAAQLSASAPV